MNELNNWLEWLNGLLYHETVLIATLATAILFTLWSGFGQWRALTHGFAVIRGKYSKASDVGAISHFKALSAALSATVGLGNIAGVAIAIMLGGPGAVLWMWIVGFFGMALKSAEVTLSMLYRNTDDADNPHGGPMWVYSRALPEINPKLAGLGKFLGGMFCVCLIIGAFTGGNIFQAFNVAQVSTEYLDSNPIWVGVALAIVVGAVILGGISRIGSVTAILVPLMCGLYVVTGLYILAINFEQIPAIFRLIISSAFGAEAQNAFLGGTALSAFLWGMKRALFSSEVGLGSSPVAHAATKTNEPVREGVVAGLEPFIDTLVVCTITALVILLSGLWNRPADLQLDAPLQFVETAAGGSWTAPQTTLPTEFEASNGEQWFIVAEQSTGDERQLVKLYGSVDSRNSQSQINWETVASEQQPAIRDTGIYRDYVGAAATATAFEQLLPGFGHLMVSLAVLLFAISTIISWSYYGEQAVIYLAGERAVMFYRIVYCVLVAAACGGLISTNRELDNISTFGFGLLLVINIPMTLILAPKAMRAWKSYIGRLKAGEFD